MMAQLPPDGEWLIQQVGDEVVLFHRYTELELVRFSVRDHDEVAKAQGIIAHLAQLNVEQRSFAHFWSGYFYGCARVMTTR